MVNLSHECQMPQDSDPVNRLVRQAAETVVKYKNVRYQAPAPEGSPAERWWKDFDTVVEALEQSIKETVAQMDKEVGRDSDQS